MTTHKIMDSKFIEMISQNALPPVYWMVMGILNYITCLSISSFISVYLGINRCLSTKYTIPFGSFVQNTFPFQLKPSGAASDE